MKPYMVILTIGLLSMADNNPAHAGPLTELLRAIARATGLSAGEEVGKQPAAQAIKATTRETLEHGTTQLIVRQGVRHGDDALRLGAGSVGRTAMASADDVARAIARVSPQNGRRLAMMMPDIQQSGKSAEVIELLAKNGKADQIIDFLWRNKEALATGALLTTVIANPDVVFSNGERLLTNVATTVGEHVAQPVIQGTFDQILAPMFRGSIVRFWLFVGVGGVVLFGLHQLSSEYRRRRWLASLLRLANLRRS